MKTNTKLITNAVALLAFFGLCAPAWADLAGKTAVAYTASASWVTDPNGKAPFYSSGDLSVFANFSARGPATAGTTALNTVLSETITITNGAGMIGNANPVLANTNYVLTGFSILISGFDSSHALSFHIYDVTTNLTGGVTNSGASYNFTANGDLLGAGNGLSWTNNTLSGAEQQVYFGLQNGPNTYGDQVILASNHTYAIEVWIPATASGAFNWYKSSSVPQDIGGEAMASGDARLSVARITGSASGFYGSSQHDFAIALYGSPTSAAPSVNNATNVVPLLNFVVDDFAAAGVGPANPTNYDYYTSSNNYAGGQITNAYGLWFGSAFQSLSWDPTSDANNNTNSGSLMLNLNFSSANTQFVVWDQGAANNFFALNLNGSVYTNFQCDVRWAPGSASDSGTFGSPIFGHLRFGDRTASYGQDWFAAVDVAASNTNWVHVSAALNAISDQNLTNIQGFIIGLDRGFYGLNLNGASTVWIDNIRFTGPSTVTTQAPPTMAIQPAVPALRIFAGSTANTFDREELATVDSNQSWIGGGAVSYSFTLLNYTPTIAQTHIFLVPAATAGQAMGNTGTANEFIEFQATNALWLVINPNANGVSASVQWKTNLPNANPNQTALVITNATAVGTWKLAFTSATAGTLTAPGASPVPFTITDPNVTTDFANPVVAYFGIQPNTQGGEGNFEDWASIAVTGVAGTQESENFTNEPSFNPNGYWANNSAQALSLQFVTASTPYWLNWTLPAGGYQVGTATSVTASRSNNSPSGWVLPEYYNGYNDGNNMPGQSNQGLKTWVLLPTTCMPTTDGNPGGPIAPNAFFSLFGPGQLVN